VLQGKVKFNGPELCETAMMTLLAADLKEAKETDYLGIFFFASRSMSA
jgi:hypothetical protein